MTLYYLYFVNLNSIPTYEMVKNIYKSTCLAINFVVQFLMNKVCYNKGIYRQITKTMS